MLGQGAVVQAWCGLTCLVKRQCVGCWKLDCDTPAWPGVDSILCLARLPRISSLYFEEKFIKGKKKVSLPHLVLQYPVEKVSSREPEFMF